MEAVDTLINARWVVPVEPDCRPLEHHTVAVRGGRIEAILPSAEAIGRFSAGEVIERPSHVLIPGLVNAHTHAAMTLFRGFADEIPLDGWLQNRIWPAEAAFVGADFVGVGVELAIAEMLRSGTTCFADMYFYPEVTGRIAHRMGIRAALGMIFIRFDTNYSAAGDLMEKARDLLDAYKGDPRIWTVFAPHAPHTVDEEVLLEIRKLADEVDLPVHMHLHETAREVADGVASSGARPLARLDGLGLLSPNLMAVHMTQLEDHEIERIATTGVSVVHCPESNLKLASGACPTARLTAAGVNVALGTDGAASNNDLDMFGEMRSAALLAKHHAADASALPAETVLRMATLNGAKALNRDDEIGSLSAGKWADITCVDLDSYATQPVYDVVSQLVYAASREQVSDVWVAGQQRVSARRVVGVDENQLFAQAEQWRARIDEASKNRGPAA